MTKGNSQQHDRIRTQSRGNTTSRLLAVRKRKPSAVCSHKASAGNLDVHLYRRTSKYGTQILAKRAP